LKIQTLVKLIGVLTFCAVVSNTTVAQERRAAGDKLRIRKLDAIGTRSKVDTPVIKSTAPRGTSRAKKWHQISMQYETAPLWIDELTAQVHVMSVTKDPETKKDVYSLFKLVIKYADIEKGRDHKMTAFLRPAAVKRYGEPIAVAIVLSIDGNVVGEISQEADRRIPKKWWSNPRIVDNANVTVRGGYLLNRSETPWAMINYDDYEVIK